MLRAPSQITSAHTAVIVADPYMIIEKIRGVISSFQRVYGARSFADPMHAVQAQWGLGSDICSSLP